MLDYILGVFLWLQLTQFFKRLFIRGSFLGMVIIVATYECLSFNVPSTSFETTLSVKGGVSNLPFAINRVQALILSPTRELAAQTEKVILAIGDFMNVQAHACIGGKSIGEDIRKLEYGVHVVSGTPGRVYDMIKRRTLRTRAIKLLILVCVCLEIH